MSVRADFDPKYFRRFLFISIGCLAFAAWFFFDGSITYPAELERAEVYWTEIEGTHEYEGMVRNEWQDIVKEEHPSWQLEAPRKPDKMRINIQRQFFYGGLCLLIALPCIYKWLTARGTWVESDGTKLNSSWGAAFDFKDIQSIDKTKWEKKGIAKIDYSADGGAKTFIFDDFKFDREKMTEILTSIEDGLKDDQITGGDRETEIKARKAEAKKVADERLETERQRVREQEEAEAAANAE